MAVGSKSPSSIRWPSSSNSSAHCRKGPRSQTRSTNSGGTWRYRSRRKRCLLPDLLQYLTAGVGKAEVRRLPQHHRKLEAAHHCAHRGEVRIRCSKRAGVDCSHPRDLSSALRSAASCAPPAYIHGIGRWGSIGVNPPSAMCTTSGTVTRRSSTSARWRGPGRYGAYAALLNNAGASTDALGHQGASCRAPGGGSVGSSSDHFQR
jgi:hypothetical protein